MKGVECRVHSGVETHGWLPQVLVRGPGGSRTGCINNQSANDYNSSLSYQERAFVLLMPGKLAEVHEQGFLAHKKTPPPRNLQ